MEDLKALTIEELKSLYYKMVNELHDLTIAENWKKYDEVEQEYLRINREIVDRQAKE